MPKFVGFKLKSHENTFRVDHLLYIHMLNIYKYIYIYYYFPFLFLFVWLGTEIVYLCHLGRHLDKLKLESF